MDWDDHLPELKRKWLEDQEELREVKREREDEINFTLAVMRADDDPTELIDLLRSNRPMPGNARELLAQYFEGRFSRGRGGKKDWLLRWAAIQAKTFYQQWLRVNEASGIKDHGHRGKMKENSVNSVIEMDSRLQIFDTEEVLAFLNRGESRQK
jgi:hypothetical protein